MDKLSVIPASSGSPVTLGDGLSLDAGSSLIAWADLYNVVHVAGAPRRTRLAKTRDLQRFVRFFTCSLGHDIVDAWTPSLTKAFQRELGNTVSGRTQRPLKATSVNRIMATVRHFGRWLYKQRPLPTGSPFAGVRDIATDDPDWNGLTQTQLTRLRVAIDQRLALCQRTDQNPLLEAAVFYVLLHTGLRAFELCSLDLRQYHHRGFHEVQRKGSKVTKKVAVPQDARTWLDRYIKERRHRTPGPLLQSRYGNRLTTKEIDRVCERIVNQANAQAQSEERFRLTPHMLRHSFLKRVADRHGVHVAQKMSGNVSIREVFRYTQPSQSEMERKADALWS